MVIDTTRFGSVDIAADDVIHFPAGLMGLEDCRDWVLLADGQAKTLAWLQSIDRAELALAVVSPRRFVPGYQMRVARRELEPLALDGLDTAGVLLILGKTGRSMVLNLKAPLVVNIQRRLGRQVVTNGELPVQYELGILPLSLKKTA